jgi:hypothetical protein
MPFNVFISYSTRDLSVVTAIQQNLERAGAVVYVAEYSTQPGQSLPEAIRRAIEGCHLFLLVWSTNAQSSEWVPQEIGVATGLRKPIMPVVLHAGLRLPAFLSDLKYLELYKNPEGAITWLQTFVAARVQQQKQGALALIGIVGAILLGLSSGNK